MSDAYIFSKKIDLIIFFILPIILLFLSSMNNGVTQFISISLILIDQLHVYYSYIQSNFYERLKKSSQNKVIVFYCLLFAFGTYIAFLFLGITSVFIIVKYMAIFHFCKQQYGWLKIINRKLSLNLTFSKFSEVSLLIYCLVPIIISHSKEYYFTWYPGVPNIFQISQLTSRLLLLVYLIFVLFYFIFELNSFFKKLTTFNLTRFSIIMFTFFSWNYTIFLMPESNFSRIFLLAGHHVLSYIFLVFYFNMKKHSEKWFLFLKKVLIITILGVFIQGLRNSIPLYPAKSLDFFKLNLTVQEQSLFFYMIPFFWTLTIFHFILDGFIWKRNI